MKFFSGKRPIALLIALGMLVSGNGFSASAAVKYSGTTTTNVNLRTGPSSKSGKAGTLDKGAEVILVASVARGGVVGDFTADMNFYKLSTGEYVAAQFIKAGNKVSDDSSDKETSDDTDSDDEETSEETTDDIDADSDDVEYEDAEEDASGEDVDAEGLESVDSDDILETKSSSDEEISTEKETTPAKTSTIQGVVTADSLKVRVAPSTSATTIKKMKRGENIVLTQSIANGSEYDGKKVSGNWYKVDTGGFVSAGYVKATKTDTSSTAKVTRTALATANVTMYSKPSINSTKQGTLSKGKTMDITSSHANASEVNGVKISGNWYKLSNGYYAPANMIKVQDTSTTGVLAKGDTVRSNSNMNVRKGPGTTYAKLGGMNKGVTDIVEEINGKWAKLKNAGGYVSVDYLTTINSAKSTSSESKSSQQELEDQIPEE